MLVALSLLSWACSPASDDDGTPCRSTVDCDEGTCVDGTCQVRERPDAGQVDWSIAMRDANVAMDDGGEADTGPEDASVPDMRPVDMGPSASMDSDGDTISDLDEGSERGTPNDTDGDGIPDYLDDDSDGDGIPDSVEAGDALVNTRPVDSDFDGTPDFRDRDSDDNGVLDVVEGTGDVDGDGLADYRDLDNDEDFLDDTVEIAGRPSSPPDSDGDGTPDYDDPDSDGDTIGDDFEGVDDTDGDGTPDRFDADSDDDGWSDAVEAGDANLATAPVDTDGDGRPDFRDTDSDGDGLSDAAERLAGTSRTSADSDSDGVSDLVEVGAGTNPLDPGDNPRARGDFVFVVPYRGAPDPTRDTLQFATTLQKADVYFLVDTTGSMGDEISALQSGLTGTIIPQVRARIADAWFGVGGFEDYPVSSWGGAGDVPFYQESTMTSSVGAAQGAVNRLALGWGNDAPESLVPAIWSLATGSRLTSGQAPPACGAGRRGFACFRSDAVPVVVIITDAISHNYGPAASDPFWGGQGVTINYSGVGGPPPTYAQAISALTGIGARVVGISSQGPTPSGWQPRVRSMLLDFSQDTDTRNAAGSSDPFFFQIADTGAGLTTSVVDAIENAAEVPIDVSARATDVVVPGESVDAVAAFIDYLEARRTSAPGLTCTTGLTAVDRPGIDADSVPDTFQRVRPGLPVCFDIVPKMNTTVMPTLLPQLFRARIDVLGDGFTPLDDREVFFLVPPMVPDADG